MSVHCNYCKLKMLVAADDGKIEITEFSFKWTPNSSSIAGCKRTKDCVDSHLFTTGPGLQWRSLSFYPRGYDETAKGFASVLLTSFNNSNITAQYAIHVFTKNKVVGSFVSLEPRVFGNAIGVVYPKYFKSSIMIDETTGMLLNDSITIVCKICMNSKDRHEFKMKQNVDRRLKEMVRLEILMDNKEFSDVIFNVDGTKFSAHKNILASKGQVFAAMFQHDMKENAKNEVDIEGINRDVFKELLRFMYAGKVHGIENIADKLLIAADRYSIEELKIICEKNVYENLTNTNAVEYLQLADIHNAPNLKKQVIDFIISNANSMLDLPEFKSIGNCQTEVVYEVFRAFTLELQKRADSSRK